MRASGVCVGLWALPAPGFPFMMSDRKLPRTDGFSRGKRAGIGYVSSTSKRANGPCEQTRVTWACGKIRTTPPLESLGSLQGHLGQVRVSPQLTHALPLNT